MGKIESKIGKTTSAQQIVKNYIVDDPSIEQEDNELNIVNNLSESWQKLSPQEYNQMRKELINKTTITSTEDIMSKDIKNSNFTKENESSENLKPNFRPPPKENKIKNKIEILLGLKNKKVYREIDGHKIGLKNLNSDQTKSVLDTISYLESAIDRIYTTKYMVLALSIDSVDDEPISNILNNNDSLEVRMEIIKNMDNTVVEELYKTYVLEIQNPISIKTQESAQEVVEEIKKS